jgi:uncharacterized membrane protein YphA (DoxX/SURF4 family)
MRVTSVGHAVFALTFIALGLLGLCTGGFAPVWQGVPEGWPAREALALACDLVALDCGIGLFWRRTAVPAAGVLLGWQLLWLLVFKLPDILRAPLVEGPYQSCGQNAMFVAGAWAFFAGLTADRHAHGLDFVAGERGVRIARVFYGLAMLAFGLSHFFYFDLTAPLVPGWLPAHTFWAYFTGGTYLAAGVSVLTGVLARLAATLSAIQIGLFTVLVWGPMLASGHISTQHWIEFVVSWTLSASAWVVAESYWKRDQARMS